MELPDTCNGASAHFHWQAKYDFSLGGVDVKPLIYPRSNQSVNQSFK